jgi:hypothetical protein
VWVEASPCGEGGSSGTVFAAPRSGGTPKEIGCGAPEARAIVAGTAGIHLLDGESLDLVPAKRGPVFHVAPASPGSTFAADSTHVYWTFFGIILRTTRSADDTAGFRLDVRQEAGEQSKDSCSTIGRLILADGHGLFAWSAWGVNPAVFEGPGFRTFELTADQLDRVRALLQETGLTEPIAPVAPASGAEEPGGIGYSRRATVTVIQDGRVVANGGLIRPGQLAVPAADPDVVREQEVLGRIESLLRGIYDMIGIRPAW